MKLILLYLMEVKKLFTLIDEYDEKKKTQVYKYTDFRRTSEEELLFIISKPIFFYDDDKFKCQSIKEKKNTSQWINLFINSINSLFISCAEISDETLVYGMAIKFFCDFYDNIKVDCIDFLNEMEKMKSKIDFDLFEAAVCFTCYLNNNKKFENILSKLNKESLIKNLKIDNDILTKGYLYYTLTDYCVLYKIPIMPNKEYESTDVRKDKIINEIKELKCYAEVCPISKSYRNFLLSLCSCMKDSEDIRKNQEKKVVEFIELIFTMLNIHLRKTNYWEDSNLSIIMNDIYKSSYEYCTDNFDENYIDFVISYITKYKISYEDFSYMFLKGLNKDEFNKIFSNLNLEEDIENLYNKETIKKLIDNIYKKKKKASKSLTKNIQGKNIENNDISNSKKSYKSKEINQKQRNEIHSSEIINKNNNEIISIENNKEKNKNIIEDEIANKILDKHQDKKTSHNEINNHEKNENKINEITFKKYEKISTNNIIYQEENKDNLKQKNETKAYKDPKKNVDDFRAKNINEEFLNLREIEERMEKKMEILKKENEDKITNIEKENKQMKEMIGDMKMEIVSLQKKNDDMKDQNNDLKEEIVSLHEENNDMKVEIVSLHEENEDMKVEIFSLQKKNRKKGIEIKELKSNLKLINLELERISFRDLSKRVLNNMINFVNKKNVKLLANLSKRKEKLNKINDYFDFKGIEFMKKPFKEILDRYYNSNSRSHVPDIAKNVKQQPLGLTNNPSEIILKKYYDVMIDSKQDKVLEFLSNELDLKNEINKLYL